MTIPHTRRQSSVLWEALSGSALMNVLVAMAVRKGNVKLQSELAGFRDPVLFFPTIASSLLSY